MNHLETVLELKGLTKYYGKLLALNNVSFSVTAGSVFGIIGPNGRGKTTMLGIVMDILKASAGTFDFFGKPASAETRKQVGTLLETPNFYHYLSAIDNLAITAAIKGSGHNEIDTVLQRVNLYERRHSKFSTYSLGMKQRLAIGAAMLGNPQVLVLDEPTNGLDPVGIAEIRTLLQTIAVEGKTITLARHLLDEVEKVCTHVAILKRGQLITAGPVDEVLVNEDIVEISAADTALLEQVISNMGGFVMLKKQGQVLQLHYPINTAKLDSINRFCFEHGLVLNHLQLKRKSLETRFLELTNN